MKRFVVLISTLLLSLAASAQVLILDQTIAANTPYQSPTINVQTQPYNGVQYLVLSFTPLSGAGFTGCGITVDSFINNWTTGGAIPSQSCLTANSYTTGTALSVVSIRLQAAATGVGSMRVQLWGYLSPVVTGSGTITGVTAGAGLAGGGVSGNVTLTLGNLALTNTQLTTNGDLLTVVGGALGRLGQGANGTFLGVSGGVLGYYTPSGGGSGTVTSVATTAPLTGGTFTTSGTIACPTCATSAAALNLNGVVIGGGLQATSTISVDSTATHALFATAGAPAFRAIASGDIPTLNQSTTGNAATATALASVPTNCGANVAASGILANGNATGCFTPTGSGTVTSSTAGQFTGYTSTGTTVVGLPDFTFVAGAGTAGVAGSVVGSWSFANATSGTITVAPPAGALGAVTNTLQAVTDTFVYRATTDTLTNKSIAASEINSGTLAAAQMPALTGDVTSTAGTVVTTVVKINGTALSGLATGVLKNTTGTGVPSIAVAADIPTVMTTLGDSVIGGASGVQTRLAGPTGPNGIPETITSTPSGGVAAAQVWSIPGVAIDAQTGTSYTIPVIDDVHFLTGSNASATAWTGFALANSYAFSGQNLGAGLITYTPASGTVNGNATQIIPQYAFFFHYTDNTNTYMPVTPTLQSFTNCTDTSGNHLNYTAATGAFSCGTSSSGGGTPSFPVTVAGTVTSGGIPYFSSTTVETSSALLPTGDFVLGGGAGGAPTATFSVVPVANGGTALASGTSGGILGYTATGTLASSIALTANVLIKGGGAGATPLLSLITDNGTTATYTGTGGYVAPLLVANGAGAGYSYLAAGSENCVTGQPVNSYCREAPATITTAFHEILPGAAATGIWHASASGVAVTDSISAVDLSGADATGIMSAARMPALTGDVTNSAGAVATTIANLAITNAKIANTTIDLTAKVTGLLPVANGGIALASGTSGGILGYTATGTIASSVVLTANILVKGGGAGATPLNSLITDNGTSATYTGTGGYIAPVFVSSGTTAGFADYPQGTTSTAVAPCNVANSICEQAPTAVTSYLVNKPGAAAGGTLIGTNTSAVITQGFSGDANHSATVTTGSGTSIGSTSLCSTTFCPVGTYRVNAYTDITTACGTTGTYVVNLIFTDDQGSKTVPMNLSGTGSVPATGVLTTTSTANFGYDAFILRSTGGASINYSTTAVACGTAGPMVGKLYLSVEPIQ